MSRKLENKYIGPFPARTKVQALLDRIKKEKQEKQQFEDNLLGITRPNYNPLDIQESNLSRKDWYRFRAKFIKEINGEPVQDYSGMTHSEFMHYIATGYLENAEFDQTVAYRLRDIIKRIDDEN